jgi:hypothetical protein
MHSHLRARPKPKPSLHVLWTTLQHLLLLLLIARPRLL